VCRTDLSDFRHLFLTFRGLPKNLFQAVKGKSCSIFWREDRSKTEFINWSTEPDIGQTPDGRTYRMELILLMIIITFVY